MTLLVRDARSGHSYQLASGAPLAEGGEAFVYNVLGNQGLVAKLYKKPRPERAAKLAFMLDNPPSNPTAAQNHAAYAWPTALLSPASDSSVIGFLMPRVTGMKEVFTFYNPRARRETCAHFDYRYLMQTARNIAGVMAELHSKGYLIADVSQKNVLVSDAALVTVLDTDSFEFRDPKSNFLHLCNVRTPGFIAPEGYTAAPNDPRTIAEDRFALAVLIFHLLMEGVHPFTCKHRGPEEMPRLQQNVMAGRFPYQRDPAADYEPMPAAPPFSILPSQLQALFVRCFVEGHKAPDARPTAREWQRALDAAAKDLKACSTNKHHFYGAHLNGECQWCARVTAGFRDPFPAVIQSRPSPEKSRTRRRQPAAETPSPALLATASSPSAWPTIMKYAGLAAGLILLLMGLFS